MLLKRRRRSDVDHHQHMSSRSKRDIPAQMKWSADTPPTGWSDCTVHNDTTIVCPSPQVNLYIQGVFYIAKVSALADLKSCLISGRCILIPFYVRKNSHDYNIAVPYCTWFSEQQQKPISI